MEEKGMGGTGYAAISILNALAACDRLSGLYLFQGTHNTKKTDNHLTNICLHKSGAKSGTFRKKSPEKCGGT